MITVSKEDYLKAIAEAEAEGLTVIPATLAHWLAVTRPAVSFALKRLTKDGLVSIRGTVRRGSRRKAARLQEAPSFAIT